MAVNVLSVLQKNALPVSAVIANGILKPHGFISKVAKTLAREAKLAGLETMFELEVDMKQAASEEYSEDVFCIPI